MQTLKIHFTEVNICISKNISKPGGKQKSMKAEDIFGPFLHQPWVHPFKTHTDEMLISSWRGKHQACLS